jgi:hypothetical protein
MQPTVPSPSSPDPAKGLPPVEPPTFGYLARQFLVPLLIVLSVLVVFAACAGSFNWFFGALVGTQSVSQAMQNIDHANSEIRWRAANDLAQLLVVDEKDKAHVADPKLALDLTQRLRQALDQSRQAEAALLERTRKPVLSNPESEAEAVAAQRKALKFQRKYLLYLSSCVGYLYVPAGASLLRELATGDEAEASAIVLRRRQAVFALASLGERVQRFRDLPEEKQTAVLEGLREEAQAGGDRGGWAQEALDLLENGRSPGVEGALAACSRGRDPYLRKVSALALGFWTGPGSEEALDALTADSGEGEDMTGDDEEDAKDGERRLPHPQALYREEIQQQAVQALAMRGSPRVEKHLPRLAAMLDEEKQAEALSFTADGREVRDPAVVVETIRSTLKTVRTLHAKQPTMDLSSLDPALEKLTRSSNRLLQVEALPTRGALQGK